MDISAISGSNSYSPVNNLGSQSNAEQLKLEEQKLQKELNQLKTKPADKSNQTKEKALEREISKIEQEIQNSGNGSSAQSSTEAQDSYSSPFESSGYSKLNALV